MRSENAGMSDLTAEKLAQRVVSVGLLDGRQMESVWTDLGKHEVPVEEFTSLLLRKNLCTNFQIDRLLKGERGGYFFGEYKVLYFAGAGTFARVYRAVHRTTGKVVAVKVLRNRFKEDASATEAFLREGRIGIKLRHPNVVPIYEVSEDPKQPYLVMEFVEGRTLRDFVKVRKKLEAAEAMQLTIDIISGLVHATEKGMQHRDLKMSNVLITSRGQAKIVDFGLAAVATGETEEDDFKNPRTIDYAGLERASGVRSNDARSDFFFVGTMLYNMLTGVPPMSETKDRMQRLMVSRFTEIKPIHEVLPELPPSIANFVQRSLEVNPEKRFATAVEMLNEAKRAVERMNSKETEALNSTAAKRAALAAASGSRDSSLDNEGQGRAIMIVESKAEMQDLLRERLKKYGYRVLIISDPERAVNRFLDDKVADCIVFSAAELGESALEAFNRFGTLPETSSIPAVLFVDQRQTAIIKAAQTGPKRVLLISPLKVKELRETLLRLIQSPPTK